MQTPSVKDTGPSGAQLFVVARGPADAVGVYYGNFKRDVRPLLQERLEGTAKDLRVTLSQLVRRASSLDGALLQNLDAPDVGEEGACELAAGVGAGE